MQLKPEIQKLLDFKKNYCERHQIVYTDTHVAADKLLIAETLKFAGNFLVGFQLAKPETVYNMDTYGDQVPNTSVDYNKREKE